MLEFRPLVAVKNHFECRDRSVSEAQFTIVGLSEFRRKIRTHNFSVKSSFTNVKLSIETLMNETESVVPDEKQNRFKRKLLVIFGNFRLPGFYYKDRNHWLVNAVLFETCKFFD